MKNDDLNKCFSDGLELLGRILTILWNTFMRALIVLNVMPFFTKRPKLMPWFIVLLCCIVPPVTLALLGMSFMALAHGVRAEDNFIVTPREPCSELPWVSRGGPKKLDSVLSYLL